MRIVCPACAAIYEVPDGRMSAGRIVRCARCATDWVPLPRTEPVPEATVAERPLAWPEPPAARPPPVLASDPARRDLPARGSGGWALGLAWVLSLAAVLAVLAGAVVARDRVMTAWPPSVRAYQALGLN